MLYRKPHTSKVSPFKYRGPDPSGLTIGFLMAREFGDDTTARRLGRKLASMENARFFDSDDGQDADEYGYFVKYGERYPRGQESALYMLKHLLDCEGEWGRAVSGVGYRKVFRTDSNRHRVPKKWDSPWRGMIQSAASFSLRASRRPQARAETRPASRFATSPTRAESRFVATMRSTNPGARPIPTRSRSRPTSAIIASRS